MPDLPIVYHPDYVAPLPAGHRFPMAKFSGLYDRLIRDGIASVNQIHQPTLPPQAWIEQVHASDYVNAYRQGGAG